MSGDNDIRITVDADNRTTAAFGEAARGARTVGEATQNANRSLREAETRYTQAALRLQQLASRQREAAERAQRFAQEQLAVRAAIAAAGTATAEQTQRLQHLTRQQQEATVSARLLESQHRSSTEQVNDLARAYQRAQNNAQQALRASLMFGAGARLGPDGTVGGAGDNGPNWFMRSLARLPGLGGLAASGANAAGGATSNPIVGSALLGVGAGALALGAPLIGGAVTGAIGAAAGFGGVGLGVAGAIANDPDEFRKRWDAVIQSVTGRWVKASASWVEPVKGSIAEVDKMLRALPIEEILSNSAGYLEPLTKGLTGLGSNLGGGLASLIGDVGPVVDMLGKRLPKLGADFGNFFAAIGKGSKGGAVALDDVLYAVGRLTKGLGVTLGALANVYKSIHDNFAALGDMAGKSADWVANLLEGVPVLDSISKKIKDFRDNSGDIEQGTIRFRGAPAAEQDFKIVENAAAAAAKAVKAYVDSTQQMLDQAAAGKNATLALAQGWLTLKEELKDGKRTLDLSTQAGIDNQKALLDQVQAAEAVRQKQIEMTGDIDAANASFDANIERIRQMAYQLGFNKTQVDNLITSLGVLNVTKAAPKVEVTGAQLAMQQGIALGALLNNIAHTYTAKVQVVTGPGISLGNALHHAAGGPTSGASVVNDWGPGTGELIRTPDGSTVIPAGTGRAMMQGLTGGGQGGTTKLVLGSDGSRFADFIIDTIAVAMRGYSGDPSVLGLRIAK